MTTASSRRLDGCARRAQFSRDSILPVDSSVESVNSKESGGRQRETGDQSYTRRHVVATLAAGGAIAVVGCSGSDESGADTGTTARQASTATPTQATETVTPIQATETATPTDTATPFPLPSRPEGYETPEPPAFEEPDEVRDGTEIFRGVPFEETPDGTLHLDLYLPADADSEIGRASCRERVLRLV